MAGGGSRSQTTECGDELQDWLSGSTGEMRVSFFFFSVTGCIRSGRFQLFPGRDYWGAGGGGGIGGAFATALLSQCERNVTRGSGESGAILHRVHPKPARQMGRRRLWRRPKNWLSRS